LIEYRCIDVWTGLCQTSSLPGQIAHRRKTVRCSLKKMMTISLDSLSFCKRPNKELNDTPLRIEVAAGTTGNVSEGTEAKLRLVLTVYIVTWD